MGDATLALRLNNLLEDVDEHFRLAPEVIAACCTAGPREPVASAIRTAALVLGIKDPELTRDQAVVSLRLAAAMMREDSLETALRIAREPVMLRSHLQHALIGARVAWKILKRAVDSVGGITDPREVHACTEQVGSIIINLTEAGVKVEGPRSLDEES